MTSRLISRTLTGAALALGMTLLPAKLAPGGALEVQELCASGVCMESPGQWCFSAGQALYNQKRLPPGSGT